MRKNVRMLRRMLAWFTVAECAVAIAASQQLTDVLSSPVPEILRFENGKSVRNAADWEARRAELMNLFATQVYGRTPRYTAGVTGRLVLPDHGLAFGNEAIRKQVNLEFSQGSETRVIHVLIYRPANAKGAVPVIEGLNFFGNQTVAADPGVALNDVWVRDPSAPKNGANNERQPACETASHRRFAWKGRQSMASGKDSCAWVCLGNGLLWRYRTRFCGQHAVRSSRLAPRSGPSGVRA